MSRQFSLPTVLRMVPNVLLQQFFEHLGHGTCGLNWPELPEREIEPIRAFLEDSSSEELNEIESALRSVFDLASEGGFFALLEAAPLCEVPDLGSQVPEELTVYGRAMWVWLHYRQVFEKAQIIYQVDHLSWWRKRNNLPQNEPDLSLAATERLEASISELLQSQGRGKDCTVELMKRGDVIYFFAHPDDFVQNVVIHDKNGQLTPEAFRQTLLIVFAYDQTHGSLETFSKLPGKLKERLEVIFTEAVLHGDLDPYEPEAAYELNSLKNSTFDLSTDPADALRVSIRRMRLSSKHCGRRVTLEVDTEDPYDDIYKTIEGCINLRSSPLSEWNVTQVTLCFEFLPLDGRKHGRQSFDVTYPRSCSLRNARPERVELIQKYLKRWGIDVVSSPEVDPIAVGV